MRHSSSKSSTPASPYPPLLLPLWPALGTWSRGCRAAHWALPTESLTDHSPHPNYRGFSHSSHPKPAGSAQAARAAGTDPASVLPIPAHGPCRTAWPKVPYPRTGNKEGPVTCAVLAPVAVLCLHCISGKSFPRQESFSCRQYFICYKTSPAKG